MAVEFVQGAVLQRLRAGLGSLRAELRTSHGIEVAFSFQVRDGEAGITWEIEGEEIIGVEELAQGDGLQSMTVADLRELAGARGVDLTGATLKADIITRIRADVDGDG